MGAQFSTAQRRAEANRRDADRQAQVDAMADGIPDDAVQRDAERLLNPVYQLVKNAETFADFETGLRAIYPQMDDGGVADTNEKVTLTGAAAGKLAFIGGGNGA
jgi:phage gp29-like protein